FRRFEPTARDTAIFTKLLAERRANTKRAVHNFGTFLHALGDDDQRLQTFVDSSGAVFQHFAHQDANLQRTIALLPAPLQVTQRALAQTQAFADQAGPALQALLPFARSLGPALQATRPFLRETTPIIQSQIRPFTRAALPVVKVLRPAAADFAAATPNLTAS